MKILKYTLQKNTMENPKAPHCLKCQRPTKEMNWKAMMAPYTAGVNMPIFLMAGENTCGKEITTRINPMIHITLMLFGLINYCVLLLRDLIAKRHRRE